MELQSGNPIDAERQRLEKKRLAFVEAFTKAASSGEQKHLAHLFIKIRQTNEFLEAP